MKNKNSSEKSFYDVIVIGAGIAGSYLAGLLAKNKLNVLVIEKSKKIKTDSGIVSTDIKKIVKLKKSFIKYEIKKMKFVSPSKYEFYLKSEKPYAYILKREEFGYWLRYAARKSGAKFIYNTCERVEINLDFVGVWTISQNGTRQYFVGKLLIGADGVNSIVRNHIDFNKQPKVFSGLICKTLTSISKEITVYLNKYYSPHFFAWYIPCNNEVGMICKNMLMNHFIYFQKSLDFDPTEHYFAPIIVSITKSYSNRCLLVGDACGQTKPISCGGIIYSLKCSKIANKMIQEAFKENRFDESFLSRYERRWKKEIGFEIFIQSIARKIYRKMSNKQVDEFFRDFAGYIENIKDFDYDRLSSIILKLPKFKLLKFLLKNLSILAWSYD